MLYLCYILVITYGEYIYTYYDVYDNWIVGNFIKMRNDFKVRFL